MNSLAPQTKTNAAYDFDQIVDRSTENSKKWRKYVNQDIIPFWVADMDFQAVPAIQQAVLNRAQGVFGYSDEPTELSRALQNWLKKRFQWSVETNEMIWKSGMVPFLNIVSRHFHQGQKIVVPTPVYYHLFNAPEWNNQQVAYVPMLKENTSYALDLNSIESELQQGAKLINLCSPMNPGGRLFNQATIDGLTTLVQKYDCLICSDEIHADLVLTKTAKHIPLASANATLKNNSIVLMAPSKTFNIPGLSASCCIVQNPELLEKMKLAVRGILCDPSCIALEAANAAYTFGEPWLEDLLQYLRGNLALIEDFFSNHPDYEMSTPHEATYLAWVKAKKIAPENLLAKFEEQGVGISDGESFKGPGYFRLNFGCPRQVLKKGLDRISKIRV